MLRRRLWKKKLRVPVNTCCSGKASWRMEEREKEELEKEVRKYKVIYEE
jgi:hypothetical protein